ncbi:MAG: hypothetical protein AABW46_01070 [Nanoarchaeota archaeon]
MATCGMYTCRKCGVVNLIFGVLLLIAGLGLWSNAPSWFNGWTIIGAYLLLWGVGSGLIGKEH